MSGSWITANETRFSTYQSGLISPISTTPGSPTALPAANTTVKNPEQILVQAHRDNVGAIIVAQGSTVQVDGSSGGFVLEAGQQQVLPNNTVSVWKMVATAAGQKLIYTYLAGAN
mgnify:CR=1 FL=1